MCRQMSPPLSSIFQQNKLLAMSKCRHHYGEMPSISRLIAFFSLFYSQIYVASKRITSSLTALSVVPMHITR